MLSSAGIRPDEVDGLLAWAGRRADEILGATHGQPNPIQQIHVPKLPPEASMSDGEPPLRPASHAFARPIERTSEPMPATDTEPISLQPVQPGREWAEQASMQRGTFSASGVPGEVSEAVVSERFDLYDVSEKIHVQPGERAHDLEPEHTALRGSWPKTDKMPALDASTPAPPDTLQPGNDESEASTDVELLDGDDLVEDVERDETVMSPSEQRNTHRDRSTDDALLGEDVDLSDLDEL